MRNKYNARKTSSADGQTFPSALEASVYEILKLRERAGEITNIRLQHRVELTLAKIGWKIDFSFTDVKTGLTVYAESKGIETADYVIKKRLWEFYGFGNLEIWKGSWKSPKLVEIVVPKLSR